MKTSEKTTFEYMTNNSPYCDSLLGSQLTLKKMYNFFIDALIDLTLSNYIIRTILINDATLLKNEWKEVIDEVIKIYELFK